MYGWLWRHTPGPVWARVILALVVVFGVVYVCFEHFFPWLSPRLPFNELTVDDFNPSDAPSPGTGRTEMPGEDVDQGSANLPGPSELPGEDVEGGEDGAIEG
jgi:hypothetical protein